MLFMTLFLVFAIVTAMLWFQGLWNCAISLMNILLAAMLATNFYEPLATMIDKQEHSYTYLYDFLLLWGLFALSFTLLRLVSEFASSERVKFILPVEMAGRSILALWAGWLMVCFTAMTLHTAPVQANPFGGSYKSPTEGTFMGFAPERQWLGFMQSRSQGVFSATGNSSSPYPEDENLQVFDPQSEFLIKHYHRRKNLEATTDFRVR